MAVIFLPRQARADFPTIEAAIQRARTQALVVSEAQAELGVARSQLTSARVSSLGNPYSEIQVDRPFTDGTQGRDVGREVQAMTWNYFPLDIAGQRGKRISEAERLIEWRTLGLVDARALAAGDVVAVYGELVVSWSRVDEASQGESTAREEAKYFQGRFEAKDTTLYEKSLAEAEIARWVQARTEAELRVVSARARFGQLTGIGDPDKPPANIGILPPPLRGVWDVAQIARVVDRAPVISRLLAEKTYWSASIERYEREKYPPVAFELIAGRGSLGEARFGAGAVITVPVTRRYQGEIARAESGVASAMQRLDLLRRVVTVRLHAAREALQSVTRALEELDKNGIPALERGVSSSLEGFRAGKIDLSRAMLARRDLATGRARRLDLVEAAWRAYAELALFNDGLP
ncbi:MAG: TolC family protein [Labilithrix sp.]|nr:TolC family protein [Labilithrix sp.]